MFKIKKCPTTHNRPARHCKVDILAPKIHFSRRELLLGSWGLQGSWGSSVHRTASNSLPSQPLPCSQYSKIGSNQRGHSPSKAFISNRRTWSYNREEIRPPDEVFCISCSYRGALQPEDIVEGITALRAGWPHIPLSSSAALPCSQHKIQTTCVYPVIFMPWKASNQCFPLAENWFLWLLATGPS